MTRLRPLLLFLSSVFASAQASTKAVSLCGVTMIKASTNFMLCGTNDVIYLNEVEFLLAACRNASLQLKTASCATTCRNTACYTNTSHICGSDGLTYRNLCTFHNAMCDKPSLLPTATNLCPEAANVVY